MNILKKEMRVPLAAIAGAACLLLGACGGGGPGSSDNGAKSLPTATELVTGASINALQSSSTDGNNLAGIAVDSAGNVFVSSSQSGNVYKLPAGNLNTVNYFGTVSSGTAQSAYSAGNNQLYLAGLAGILGIDLASSAASPLVPGLTSPSGVAADASGNAYVVQGGAINKYSPTGTLLATLVSASTTFTPDEIAVDSGGSNIYVTDPTHHEVFKIPTNGGVPTVFAGSGTAGTTDGTGAAASFSRPTGIAVSTGGNVYVVDQGTGQVRQISPQGVVTTLITLPNGATPTAIALDAAGKIYVTTQGAGTNAGVWRIDQLQAA